MRKYNSCNISKIEISELPDDLLRDIYSLVNVKNCFIEDDGSDLVYYRIEDSRYYTSIPVDVLRKLCLIHRFYEVEIDVWDNCGELEYNGIYLIFHYYKRT